MFEMKEEYKLKISHIDEQHEKLFEIMERAYHLLQDEDVNDKYDDIKAIIIELRKYAEIHFKDEEAYMESINCEFIDLQKSEHNDFIKYVHDFEIHKVDQNEDKYIMEILDFLYDWLVNHILKKDMLIVTR